MTIEVIGPSAHIAEGTNVVVLFRSEAVLPSTDRLASIVSEFGDPWELPSEAEAAFSLLATGSFGALAGMFSDEPAIVPRIGFTAKTALEASTVYARIADEAKAAPALAALPPELGSAIDTQKWVKELQGRADEIGKEATETLSNVAEAAAKASKLATSLPWIIGGLAIGGVLVIAGVAWYVSKRRD